MGNEDLTNTKSTPIPDPTVLTTKQLHHELKGIKREFHTRDVLYAERLQAQQHDAELREAHRLELKADNQRSVETAMNAAEKAVQAALAAAEKARDQQTIASQLATTKAENSSKEQMEQQGATFSLAISGLNTSVQDMKGMLGADRAEKKGGQEQVTEHRASIAQVVAIAAGSGTVIGVIVAIITVLFGG